MMRVHNSAMWLGDIMNQNQKIPKDLRQHVIHHTMIMLDIVQLPKILFSIHDI
jgi:hypothetical protein